jgi:Domain of unknown function (DUF4124)
MQINKLLTITLLTLTPILAQAAIYKWVDEQGNVQYSSEKPKDAEAEKVRVTTQPPVDRSTYRRPGQDDAKAEGDAKADAKDKDKAKDDKTKTPAEKRKEAAKKSESDKLKKEMCDEARQNLAAIENSARVRIEDDKGEVRYMEEKEVDSRKKSEQERVNKYCK